MKQHISTKQLNELSEKGKKRLKKWWKPETMMELVTDGDKAIVGMYIPELEANGIKVWPLLSIGQMIEFLDENSKFLCILNCKDHWEVGYSIDHPDWDGIELCDALWMPTKEILEK